MALPVTNKADHTPLRKTSDGITVVSIWELDVVYRKKIRVKMESNFWLQRIHFNDFAHNFDHSLLPIEADR